MPRPWRRLLFFRTGSALLSNPCRSGIWTLASGAPVTHLLIDGHGNDIRECVPGPVGRVVVCLTSGRAHRGHALSFGHRRSGHESAGPPVPCSSGGLRFHRDVACQCIRGQDHFCPGSCRRRAQVRPARAHRCRDIVDLQPRCTLAGLHVARLHCQALARRCFLTTGRGMLRCWSSTWWREGGMMKVGRGRCPALSDTRYFKAENPWLFR